MKLTRSLFILLLSALLISTNYAFESDELLVDDEEFGLEGGRPPVIDLTVSSPSPIPSRVQSTPKPTRKRSVDSESDSRVQFVLEHAIGDSSEFSAAGTFTARLKASANGGQVYILYYLMVILWEMFRIYTTSLARFECWIIDDDVRVQITTLWSHNWSKFVMKSNVCHWFSLFFLGNL